MIKEVVSIDAWVTVFWETTPICSTIELARDVAHTSQYRKAYMFVVFSFFYFIFIDFYLFFSTRQTPSIRAFCPAPDSSASSGATVPCKAYGGWGAGRYCVHECTKIFLQARCTCWGRRDHYFVTTPCFTGFPPEYIQEIDPSGMLDSIKSI